MGIILFATSIILLLCTSFTIVVSADNDDTYNKIMAMQNITLPHQCFVAVIDGSLLLLNDDDDKYNNSTTYPVVWCDIIVPTGLNVTAEIRDGECQDFTDPASSQYYTQGTASPMLIPEFSEEEKLQGSIDHTYCAGVDILYDVNATGSLQSVLKGRFAMNINYMYTPIIDEESGEVVDETLSSATLSDDSTRANDRNEALSIGLGVLAGSVVTIALIAIIYGGRKKRRALRRVQEIEAEQAAAGEEEDGHAVEIAPMV